MSKGWRAAGVTDLGTTRSLRLVREGESAQVVVSETPATAHEGMLSVNINYTGAR